MWQQVRFEKEFLHYCESLIESIMRRRWTFACHFSFAHNGNSQSRGKSLKATWRICFSPLVEMSLSLRLMYFRKQHTFRAASCVSAWATVVIVQRYWGSWCLCRFIWERGVFLAGEPFKWDKLYRNTAPLIPFLGVRQSCLHMKRDNDTKHSWFWEQPPVFWQRTGMLKKGYGAGSGSLALSKWGTSSRKHGDEKQMEGNSEGREKRGWLSGDDSK